MHLHFFKQTGFICVDLRKAASPPLVRTPMSAPVVALWHGQRRPAKTSLRKRQAVQDTTNFHSRKCSSATWPRATSRAELTAQRPWHLAAACAAHRPSEPPGRSLPPRGSRLGCEAHGSPVFGLGFARRSADPGGGKAPARGRHEPRAHSAQQHAWLGSGLGLGFRVRVRARV